MDTKKITVEILETGLTEQELADRIPCSQSTINAFRNGKRGARPSLVIGTRLLELHKELCPPPAGRNPISIERMMTVVTEQPVLYELAKPKPTNESAK